MKFGSQLTDEQLEDRRKGIGASDAAKIIAGGEDWVTLWKDKTGREKPRRIMSEWDAALRHVTEDLQCDWYEHKTGDPVICRGDVREFPEWTVLRCTLDGLTHFGIEDLAVFEAKHVSSFTPDPIKWAIEKYTPQINHQMIVTGCQSAVMSVIVGMSEPVWVNFTLDPFFAEAYVDRCRDFWSYVERDEPPPGAEMMAVPVISLEEMREVDYSASNEFGDWAAQWLENRLPAKRFQEAEKGLKGLVEADVKRAFNGQVEIKRSKAGALTVKPIKD